MAIKVKKKQSKADAAAAPDTIYSRTSSLFNWLETHRTSVLMFLGVVLVVIAIVASVSSSMSEGDVEAGAEVSQAVLISTAQVGPEAEGDRTYDTAEERATAVREALAVPLESSPPTPAAALLDATSSVELNDLGRAQERFQAVAGRDDLSLLSAVAVQGWAATQAQAGELDAAESTLDQLAARTDALGDYVSVEKARLAEASGELQAARELYNGVAERSGLPEGAGSSLADIARHRAAVLAVLTGQVPEAETPAPDGATPEGSGN